MPDANYDIILRNGEVVDGTGAPRRRADVAVKGDRISAVTKPGEIMDASGAREIDATGRVIAPGFIDTHTHDDNAVLIGPDMIPKISQGVTTVIAGNCGVSLAPIIFNGAEPPPPMNLLGGIDHFRFERMEDYVEAVTAAKPRTNIANLIGHSTLRVACMSDIGKKASAREIDAMRERLAEGLDAGPAIVLGIFSKRVGTVPAVAGMVVGLAFTSFYIVASVYGGMAP